MVFNASITIFLLVFVRSISVVSTAPILGAANVPVLSKIGIGFFLAVVLDAALPAHVLDPFAIGTSWGDFLVLVLRESLVGIAMGLAAGLVFAAVQFGGEIMDMLTGFGFGSILSLQPQGTGTLLSSFQYALFGLLFLGMNGIGIVVQALLESYRLIPVGAGEFGGPLASVFLRGIGSLSIIGLQLAAPVMFALFLSNIALAVASRVVPQMNVFAVGLPLQLLVGLGTILLALPAMSWTMRDLLFLMDRQLGDVLRAMGGLAV